MSAKLQVDLEDGWIKETQMSLQIFTELWKLPMELKCLGAFVFPHWACLDLQAFGYLWQSAHCFISFASLPCVCPKLLPGLAPIEAAVPARWPSWAFLQGDTNKGSEGREARARAERKEGLQACWAVSCWCVSWEVQPQFGAAAALAGTVFELGALRANECFHILRLHWIPRVILDSKILEQVSRRNNTKAYINSAWSAPYVRSLFF